MKKLLFILLVFPILSFGQGTMDFESVELPGSYSDGDFTESGIEYHYNHSRNEADFPIDGNGLMLRRASDSYLEWTIPDGVSTLSFDYRKAYTGGSIRQLEVLVNGEQVNTTDEFGEGSGEQNDIYTLTTDINEEGNVTIQIKNVGDASTNKQSVIDNIEWAAYENDGGAGPMSYCEPETEEFYNTDYVSEVSSEGAESDLNYSESYDPGEDLVDQTGMTLEAYPGQEIEITTSYIGGSQTIGVWIDWDENGEFGEDDPDERLFLSYESSPQSFTFVVPQVDTGEYRMRVRGSYGDHVDEGDDFACDTYSYGTAVDFTFEIIDTPSCIRPTEVTVTDLSTDTATLEWTAGADEDEWEVLYGEMDFDPEAEGESISTLNDNSVTLTDLSSNTEYDIYVRSICGEDDISSLTGPVSFITSCDAMDLPFFQDFEDVETPNIPNCASLETNNGDYQGNGWKTSSPYISGFEGNVLNHSYGAADEGDLDSWYFTQGLNLEADINYQISYKYTNNSTTYSENLKVALGTSTSSTSMTTEIVDHIDIETNDILTDEIIFTVPTDGVYYFGFQSHSNANQNQLYIDDIQIIVAPTCPAPSDLNISNITNSSADLEWTAGDEEESWDIYINKTDESAPDEDTTPTIAEVSDLSYTIEDLDANTAYTAYVRAYCSESDSSLWVSSDSFNTSCNPKDVPFFEGFEEGYVDQESLAGCWEATNWMTKIGEASYDREPRTGDGYVSLMYGYDAWMMIELELEANNTYTLEFYAKQDATSGASVEAAFGTSNDTEEMEEIIGTTEIGDEWQKVEGEFTPENDGVYYIAINGTTSYTPWYLTIDDISIDISEENDCGAPDGLAIDDITEDTAFVIWEPGMDPDEANGWEVVYGLEGFDIDNEEGTTIQVDEAPFVELDNLDESTTYDVYVRTICDETEGEYSAWVNDTFTTDGDDGGTPDVYCDIDITNSVEEITYISFADLSNTNSNDTDHYIDYTDLIANVDTESSYDISLEGNTHGDWSNTFTVWIDWNQDGLFSDEEKYEIGVITNSDGDDGVSADSSIEVPADAVEGLTRMRVIKRFNVYQSDPCEDIDYGQAHDYSVQVSLGDGSGDDEICEDPSDILVETNDENTDVMISWTANGDESEWEILYGETGFDTETEGTSEIVSEPEYTIQGLEEDTTYDVYVRAICDEDNFSDWATESFTTISIEEEVCETPSNIVIETNDENTTVEISWTVHGEESAWEVVYGLAEFDLEAQGVSETVSEPQLTIEGLEEDTTYDVYVRAICDEDNSSDWVGPESFTTTDLGVNEFAFKSFAYYPNPVANQLYLSANQEIENINIYNLLGQKVIQLTPNTLNVMVNAEKLQAGVYLMSVQINGAEKSFRIVKK